MDVVVVTIGVLLQVVVGSWVSSPWVVPDLTLIVLTLVVTRTSTPSTARPILVTALLVMCLTARHPLLAAASYLGVGWLIKAAASRWDLRQGVLPLVMIGVAEAVLLGAWLLVVGPLPHAPFLLAATRWGVTLGCGCLLLPFMPGRWSPHLADQP
ncbi:MAG: hypothetical protein A3B73_03970 [Omnitrophica WOR_2 bacterium RIFCSPHIGHO2_02_FULL_63_39]|nr:MAG: hypothetical protein A2Z92_01610 [Omnitrophica WOR_2 bacterium GWA2_63_20]OGX36030.1 MAG: hypothetical protein A3B73_03970 [Omnitrophica WOR_2 bacterium RIFCSPHIGHO2_02_FULL_63_39]OGX49062.1 MAG: hypothetical protein A3G88_05290 [Omnitrophica WOR_2 bacterium RIFCSPLOWO2_12_FULL_63_16]HBQ38715.1 hypothetical protein [Candidatus Omnitrophota bacterium]